MARENEYMREYIYSLFKFRKRFTIHNPNLWSVKQARVIRYANNMIKTRQNSNTKVYQRNGQNISNSHRNIHNGN